MPDSVSDHEPALVSVGRLTQVAVLKSLQLLPVTLLEVRGTRLYMDVVHVARAICETSDGVEQRRTDDVADLNTGVVIAVSKRRQFNKPLVVPCCRAELLRKNGVRDANIPELVAAVGDADTDIVGLGQIVIKISTGRERAGHSAVEDWKVLRGPLLRQ